MDFGDTVEAIRRDFHEAKRARLRRILARVEADCLFPLETVGCGAQSTRKRASALQMAVDGADLDEIAEAVSLSPERTARVLENFAGHGFAALYPSFVESFAEQPREILWEKMLGLLQQLPKHAGYRAPVWTPESLVDCLIERGEVEDLSHCCAVETIETMAVETKWENVGGRAILVTREAKPKTYLPQEPTAQGEEDMVLTWGFGFFCFGALLCVLFQDGSAWWRVPAGLFLAVFLSSCFFKIYRRFEEKKFLRDVLTQASANTKKAVAIAKRSRAAHREPEPTPEAVKSMQTGMGVGALFLVAGVRAIYQGGLQPALVFFMLAGGFVLFYCAMSLLRLRARRKEDAEIALDPVAPDTVAEETVQVPFSDVVIRHASALPATEWALEGMSRTANALGQKPVPILYLWVFQAYKSQSVYETHGWPQIGPVHLLLNCSALSLKALRTARRALLMSDQDAVTKSIAAYDDDAADHKRPTLFSVEGNGLSRGYRGYPIHTLVCTDKVWQDAFHGFAKRCEVAVFNLSGYQRGHPGLEFEIRHVLSGGPPQRCVFMYDRRTDADGAIDTVLSVFAGMEQKHPLLFLRYADTQSGGYAAQFGTAKQRERAKSFADVEGPYRPIAGAVIELVRTLQGGERSHS